MSSSKRKSRVALASDSDRDSDPERSPAESVAKRRRDDDDDSATSDSGDEWGQKGKSLRPKCVVVRSVAAFQTASRFAVYPRLPLVCRGLPAMCGKMLACLLVCGSRNAYMSWQSHRAFEAYRSLRKLLAASLRLALNVKVEGPLVWVGWATNSFVN